MDDDLADLADEGDDSLADEGEEAEEVVGKISFNHSQNLYTYNNLLFILISFQKCEQLLLLLQLSLCSFEWLLGCTTHLFHSRM